MTRAMQPWAASRIEIELGEDFYLIPAFKSRMPFAICRTIFFKPNQIEILVIPTKFNCIADPPHSFYPVPVWCCGEKKVWVKLIDAAEGSHTLHSSKSKPVVCTTFANSLVSVVAFTCKRIRPLHLSSLKIQFASSCQKEASLQITRS